MQENMRSWWRTSAEQIFAVLAGFGLILACWALDGLERTGRFPHACTAACPQFPDPIDIE
jgi:hypothetical protein